MKKTKKLNEVEGIFVKKQLILRNDAVNSILNMTNQTSNKNYSQHN